MSTPTITAADILGLLVTGKFKPMTEANRQCYAGASANALELDSADFYIIADCAPGEGMHVEIVNDEGTSWGLNMDTGELTQLSQERSE